MSRIVEERIRIAGPVDKVWGLLVEPRSWTSWWPAVRFARTKDFRPLRERSELEVTLEIGPLRSTLAPIVTLMAEGSSVTWKSRWLFVPLEQQWFLNPSEQGCMVTSRSTFRGFGAVLLRLIRLERRWQEMVQRQLRALKQLAERMV